MHGLFKMELFKMEYGYVYRLVDRPSLYRRSALFTKRQSVSCQVYVQEVLLTLMV